MKIIGICGGSGSGKTTLVEAVRAHMSNDVSECDLTRFLL